MILLWLILVPLAGGLLAWLVSRRWPLACRWVALLAMAGQLGLGIGLWLVGYQEAALALPASPAARAPVAQWLSAGWVAELSCRWIPQFGVRFHLAMDGLSLLLVLLTGLLGLLAVAVSWNEVRTRVGFFHLNLLWVLAGVTGVFLAMDLFLFYFFWELMLVPMYFLIDIWGHENRHYAAVKFFLFTQLSGLLMLLAILALYFLHARATGRHSFDYVELLGTPLSAGVQMVLMLGFLAAFVVKLPAVPFHTWLPDAHTEAPTAGSLILAGLLLKTGGYGILRFAVPLFPQAAADFAPVGMGLGVAGILYGAVMAFAQHDFKRLVAYTSVSHLGFVLLAAFAWTELALQGAVMQMICHGLSTGALFILAGLLQERIGTRDMRRMGGLWTAAPRLGALALFFALASLGLPGLGNFVGEFLVLLGAYQASIPLTCAATAGLVLATVYSLWIMYRVFHGQPREPFQLADLSARETAVLAVLVAALLWLGLYPQSVLRTCGAATSNLRAAAAAPRPEQGTFSGAYIHWVAGDRGRGEKDKGPGEQDRDRGEERTTAPATGPAPVTQNADKMPAPQSQPAPDSQPAPQSGPTPQSAPAAGGRP